MASGRGCNHPNALWGTETGAVNAGELEKELVGEEIVFDENELVEEKPQKKKKSKQEKAKDEQNGK